MTEIEAVTKWGVILSFGLFMGIIWIMFLPIELIRVVFGKGNLKKYFLEYVEFLKIL